MLPFVPGVVVIMMGFLVPELGVVKAVGVAMPFALSPLVFVIPVVQREARRLQREIDKLDAMMRQP